MAAHGELTPMPDCAIFADTGAEPKSVYKWLDWLEAKLPFPVNRVRKAGGTLAEEAVRVVVSKKGNPYTHTGIPGFVKAPDGAIGMIRRQCTSDFKIVIIQREVRRLLAERERSAVCHQWISISLDEATRMTESRVKRIILQYPLIDRGMRRFDCLDWMESHGYPKLPRSACFFCPYHNNEEWRNLKENEPEAFADAVMFEKKYQASFEITKTRGVPFLHRSCQPLSEVDFSSAGSKSGKLNFFNNECAGVCGV